MGNPTLHVAHRTERIPPLIRSKSSAVVFPRCVAAGNNGDGRDARRTTSLEGKSHSTGEGRPGVA
jgi:hypothetical protein